MSRVCWDRTVRASRRRCGYCLVSTMQPPAASRSMASRMRACIARCGRSARTWMPGPITRGAARGRTLLILLVCAVLLVMRYRRFRENYEQAIAANAVLAERGRMADELHTPRSTQPGRGGCPRPPGRHRLSGSTTNSACPRSSTSPNQEPCELITAVTMSERCPAVAKSGARRFLVTANEVPELGSA